MVMQVTHVQGKSQTAHTVLPCVSNGHIWMLISKEHFFFLVLKPNVIVTLKSTLSPDATE